MHVGGTTLPVGFEVGVHVDFPVAFEVVFPVDFPVVFPVIHKHSECPIHLIAKKLIIQTICNIFANLNQKVYPSVLPTNQNRYDGPKVPKRNK